MFNISSARMGINQYFLFKAYSFVLAQCMSIATHTLNMRADNMGDNPFRSAPNYTVCECVLSV